MSLLGKACHPPKGDDEITVPEHLVNDVKNMGILGLFDQEHCEEQRKVNFLWESNTAVPPEERLHDDPDREHNRPHLLRMK